MAWKAMAEKYPALPEEELVHRRLVRECAPLELALVSSSFKRPASWGVLPATAELPDEVDWVYQNYELVVEETSRGHRVDLARARCAPPSEGTMLLFRLALQNLNGFVRDVVQKVKKVGESAEDEEYVKKERKSIAEIERVLDQMMENMK
jgi:hypothetical protein